jgi:hemolysin activation/secretion protein
MMKFCASVALLAVACAAPGVAQDFKQGAPAQLPTQTPTVAAPPAPATPDAPARTVLAEVKGLVFVTAASDVVAGGVAVPANGIDVSRTPFLATPEFEAAARALLGKPASVADLNRVSRAVVLAYRAAGRPVVDVTLPEQDVTGGVVQFVVSEFEVGQVVVEGNKHFKTETIRAAIRLQPGNLVRQQELIEDLNFLALNPFRRVDVVYRRGTEPMTTDVVFRVSDRMPFRAYVGFDNSGTPATKRERLSAGLNWGDAFGGDGQLSYQATVSPDMFEGRGGAPLGFQSHSLTFFQPLANRDVILAFGTFQKVASPIGTFGSQTGKNYQASVRYTHAASADPAARLALSVGYDFKKTNNDLLFGATGITQDTQIHQFMADATATKLWSAGVFGVSGSLFLSPGGIGDRNTDSAFQPFNPPTGSTLAPRTGTFGAEAKYAYFRASVSQNTPLGQTGLEARTRFTGQIASGNLLPTEQLSAAGLGSVRGYNPNAVIGSRGFVATQELWSPTFSLLGEKSGLGDRAQIGAFIEAGQVGNEDRQPTERKWTKTAATGLSALWQIGPYLQARADYGWQLRGVGGAPKGSLGHVSVIVGF